MPPLTDIKYTSWRRHFYFAVIFILESTYAIISLVLSTTVGGCPSLGGLTFPPLNYERRFSRNPSSKEGDKNELFRYYRRS